MGTKKIEQKAYVTSIEYDQRMSDFPKLSLRLDGYKGPVTFSSNVEYDSVLAIKRAYDKRSEVKITIEFQQSDVDDARELLANGKDKSAISKALDILERLDK